MQDIVSNGRIPLLVGGTGLYFRSLERGLSPLPSADAEVRRCLADEAAARGWPALHARLARLDPVAAARIHPNDPQRIQRALEVFELTGRPMTDLFGEQADRTLPYRLLKIVLLPSDRHALHSRIGARFRDMLERGFVDEVARLRARSDLHIELPSMRAVGYRQVWQWLDGCYDARTMSERATAALTTRQLAKRQITWLRSETNPQVIDALSRESVSNILKLLQRARIVEQ